TAAWLHDVIAGNSSVMSDAAAAGAAGKDPSGRRFGVVWEMSGDRNAPEVASRLKDAVKLVEVLGAEVVEVSLPFVGHALSTYFTLSSVEALMVLERHALAPGMGSQALHRLTQGRGLYGTAGRDNAIAEREEIRESIAQTFAGCDFMIGPTMPLIPPHLGRANIDDPLMVPRTDWWTVEANLTGIPAISLPSVSDVSGLPIGVQLMAPAG